MSTPENPNEPIMGSVEDPGFVQETPEDIEDFLSDNGIKDASYVCTLKRYHKDGSEVAEWLPGSTKSSYPDIQDVGRRFGPGKYLFCFSWKAVDPDGKRKKHYKEYKILLGEEWNDVYDEYQAEKWAEKQKKIEATAMRQQYQNAVKGNVPGTAPPQADPAKAGIEQLQESVQMLRSLGMPVGGNVPANTNNDNQLQMFQMIMGMMAQSQKQSNDLMIALLTSQKPQTGNDVMKEMVNMVGTALNLKEALTPEKEGTVDKVFKLMESVLPQIAAMAQQSRAERLQNPLYQVAMQSNEMQQMKQDPNMLKSWVEKWDKKHGSENTDEILSTIGIDRNGNPLPEEPIPQPPPQPGAERYPEAEEAHIDEVVTNEPAPDDDISAGLENEA